MRTEVFPVPQPPQGLLNPWLEPAFKRWPARWFCGPWEIYLDTVSIHIMQLLHMTIARGGWIKAGNWGAGGMDRRA